MKLTKLLLKPFYIIIPVVIYEVSQTDKINHSLIRRIGIYAVEVHHVYAERVFSPISEHVQVFKSYKQFSIKLPVVNLICLKKFMKFMIIFRCTIDLKCPSSLPSLSLIVMLTSEYSIPISIDL